MIITLPMPILRPQGLNIARGEMMLSKNIPQSLRQKTILMQIPRVSNMQSF